MINALDSWMTDFLRIIVTDGMTSFMLIITEFASATTLIALTLALLFGLKEKKYGLCIFLNLAGVFIFNYLIKLIVRRPRPIGLSYITESGYSFPSAHAMVGMGFYGLIIYLLCTKLKSRKLKICVALVLGSLILMIGISRVYLGVHYATDVIAGFAFGLIFLWAFIKFVYRGKLKMGNNSNG